MSPFARSPWLPLLAALATLVFLGCSPSLEKNTTFTKLVARLDKDEKALNTAGMDNARLSTELETLKVQMEALSRAKSIVDNSAGTIVSLQQRLAALEAQVKNGATAKPPVHPVAATPTPQPEKPQIEAEGAKSIASIVPKNAAATPAAPKMTASATKKAVKTTRKTTAAPKTTATSASSSKPRGGVYYTVSPNDTMVSIATKFRMSTTAILSANQLPSSAKLYIGQEIFIPAQKN